MRADSSYALRQLRAALRVLIRGDAANSALRQFKESGDCNAESQRCVYGYEDIACAGGCATGACEGLDTCDGGCATPPDPICSNPVTLITYAAPGTCQGGVCTYPATETSCPHGCEDGACLQDTCAGVTCDQPPEPACVDSATLRIYSTPGVCSHGTCEYAHEDQTCLLGCAQGACRMDSGFTALRARARISSTHRGRRGAILSRSEEVEYIDVFNRRATQTELMDRRPNAEVILARALSMFRFLDTRGVAPLASGATTCIQVAGPPSIPATAKAVGINFVAVNPSGVGHLIAYAAGTTRPDTSTLNYGPGAIIANNAIVQPGANGEVCFYFHGATHFVLDVVGYFQQSILGDPCAGITCQSPPQPTCVGGTTLVSYEPTGTCMNGICFYPSNAELCPSWCAGSACAPTWGWGFRGSRTPPSPCAFDQILPDLVARGYLIGLIGPQNGWSTADTSSCTLSTEVRNDTSSGAVSAELRFTNFRISDQ